VVSEYFLKSHSKAGEKTDFVAAIVKEIKKHTIRVNFNYWLKAINRIKQGDAILSVRIWTGKPYNSKQKEVFRFTADDGVGIQKLKRAGNLFIVGGDVVPVSTLSANDGLSKANFLEWFKGVKSGAEMAVIHFTKFRY